MAHANDYDRIAGNYDAISQLFFRKAIVRSQQVLFPFLSSPATILIVGGGTGWILEEIAEIHSSGLQITYLDLSGKMIALAKNRDWKQNIVTFIQSDIQEYKSEQHFDFIITPFLFDNFKPDRAHAIFAQLDRWLAPNGLWLFADFHVQDNSNGIWQKVMLKCMYLFFNAIARVETKELTDMDVLFKQEKYETVFESSHFSRFIQARVYRRN
ncbi:class I SAM-dependent methyltransferase [Dyadobacter sp. CY323]|uniref:class I SAM-dependent methyltransferase n=1 Tax=Dyadobacter sp. CY323 TaxID=2907302 RepID=UPI001F31C6F5|nr:class I SAM-dependent methyltransferase [Dyadobacter sp. CY323]MCE6991029.1 class I SAM-dependent methyltransferase [Dyadobacter sp. CY323]